MEYDSPHSVREAFSKIILGYKQQVTASVWNPIQPDQYIQYYGAQRHNGEFSTYDLILHSYLNTVTVEVTGNMPDMDSVTVQIAQNIMGKIPRITLPS